MQLYFLTWSRTGFEHLDGSFQAGNQLPYNQSWVANLCQISVMQLRYRSDISERGLGKEGKQKALVNPHGAVAPVHCSHKAFAFSSSSTLLSMVRRCRDLSVLGILPFSSWAYFSKNQSSCCASKFLIIGLRGTFWTSQGTFGNTFKNLATSSIRIEIIHPQKPNNRFPFTWRTKIFSLFRTYHCLPKWNHKDFPKLTHSDIHTQKRKK